MALTINMTFIGTLCCPWAKKKNFSTMVLLIMKINKFLVWCKFDDLKVMRKIHAVAIIYFKQTSWTSSGHARKLHITVMGNSQMGGQSHIFLLYVLDIYMYKHKVLYIYMHFLSHAQICPYSCSPSLPLPLFRWLHFLNVW